GCNISENRKIVKRKIPKIRSCAAGKANRRGVEPESRTAIPGPWVPSFLRRSSRGRFRLPGAGSCFRTQPLYLPPGQGDADFADPFQFHAIDRLGIETGEVDQAGGFPAFDGLQIALARL